MREHYENSITIQEIIVLLKRYLLLILAVTLAGGLITYCVCSWFVAPVYQADAKMIVNSRKEQTGAVTNDQITSAQKLVDTYAIIIRGQYVLNPVIDALQLPMTVDKLADMITVTSVNNTQVMQIAVRSENPKQALQIVEQIVKTCPSIFIDAVDAGSVKTIEPARLRSTPVSPKKNLFTVVAAMLSLIVCVLVIILRFLLDNTYKSEMMLRNDLDLPVLGVIPDYECCIKQKKAGKGGTYYGQK